MKSSQGTDFKRNTFTENEMGHKPCTDEMPAKVGEPLLLKSKTPLPGNGLAGMGRAKGCSLKRDGQSRGKEWTVPSWPLPDLGPPRWLSQLMAVSHFN